MPIRALQVSASSVQTVGLALGLLDCSTGGALRGLRWRDGAGKSAVCFREGESAAVPQTVNAEDHHFSV